MNDIKGIIEDVEKGELVSKKVIDKVRELIGQEEWNDLFDEENDVITTTGELIITLKSLSDEKESRTMEQLTYKNDKIKELQNENAELRTKATALEYANRAMVKELDSMTSGGLSVFENIVRNKEQLTKAKDLVLRLSTCLEGHSNNNFEYELLKEAEQFLSEVGK